jgi:hypothetical protein
MTDEFQKLVQLCESYDKATIAIAEDIASTLKGGVGALYDYYGYNPVFLCASAYRDFSVWLTDPTVRYVGGFNVNVFNRKNIATLSLRRVTLDATFARALESSESKRIAKLNLKKCEISYEDYLSLRGVITTYGSKDYIGIKLTRTLIRGIGGNKAYNSSYVTAYFKFSYAGLGNYMA